MQYVCSVSEGRSARPCDTSSKEWLKSAPRGAYTTARTVHQSRVFQLSHHVERLATTAALMIQESQTNPSPPATELPPFCDAQWLRPHVVGSMQAAIEEFKRINHHHQGEMRLTTLLTWSTPSLDNSVTTHVEHLPPRPKPPIKVLVRGHPRSNAKAKDSEWVRQRQVLEQEKGADVEEVLLMTDEGQLLEGLSSNFFVLQDGKLVTAEEGVLAGTVRGIVLQVCKEEGIPICLQPPCLRDWESWQAVFIASTSRMLLPVTHLDAPTWKDPVHWECEAVDPLGAQLEQLVLEHVTAASEVLS